MIRIGIIGAGGMGNVHGSKYTLMPDVELGFFEPNAERREAYVARHKAQPFESLDDLLKWADALDICLPTDMHLDNALKAIAAGKHVLCEKPMALTIEEAVQMMQAADKAGVVLMPAQVVRCFPDFRKAKALVSAGKIGEPVVARTRRGGGAPVGSEGWFTNIDRSGGVLLDLAVHDFDFLRWIMGEVHTVNSRSVRIGNPTSLEGKPGDYSLTTLSFDSGAIAHVEGTWLDPSGFRTTFDIVGTAGTIEHDSRKNPVVRVHAGGTSRTESFMAPADDPYFLQARGFIEACQGKTPAPVSALDGVMAVSIARAAIESAKTLKPVAVAREF